MINNIQKNILNKQFTANIISFLIFVIALMLIYTVFLQVIGSTPNAFHFIRYCAGLSAGMDSWNPMILALTHCKQFPDISIYQELLIENGIKFQYPPTSLLLFDIPERIFGIHYHMTATIYNAFSWVSGILIVVFTSKMLTLVIEKYDFGQFNLTSNKTPFLQFIIIGIITVLFYPLIHSYRLGQIQTILTMLATLVLYYYLCDKKRVAGLCLGLICLVKPQLGLIFVWGLIRKEWLMVISGCITIVAVLLPSILLYGFHNHWDYLAALSHLSRYGECFYANQSVNGLMNRLLFNGNNLNWSGTAFPPFNLTVYVSTLFSSVILILFGLLWGCKNTKPNVIKLSIMMLCTTMASPIAWEHHYGILLPIFVLLSPFILYYYQTSKWKIWMYALAFVMASQYLSIVNKLANSYLNILQSYLYFAALVILAFLFLMTKKLNKCDMKE